MTAALHTLSPMQTAAPRPNPPRPLGRMLTAAEAGLYRDAAEALTAARATALAIRQEAATAIAAERESMRRGLAEDANRKLAQQLAEGSARIDAMLAGLRHDAAETIAAAIARVLGDLDVATAVTAAAERALADLAARHGTTVHVHPACAASARAALAETDVRVVADESLPQDACTIETEAGIVRAGLSDQIAMLRAALVAAASSSAPSHAPSHANV